MHCTNCLSSTTELYFHEGHSICPDCLNTKLLPSGASYIKKLLKKEYEKKNKGKQWSEEQLNKYIGRRIKFFEEWWGVEIK